MQLVPIRVLMVEDEEDDAELLLRVLRKGGFEPVLCRVETAESFIAELSQQTWDIIIADYVLPQFSGLAALRIIKQRRLDIPFIIVSGTIGEELAVTAMRAGAQDYVMKNNLIRLVPAIKRELQEAQMRHEKYKSTRMLKFERKRAQVTLNAIGDGIITTNVEGKVDYLNPAAAQLTGWQQGEAEGRYLSEVLILLDEKTRFSIPDPAAVCLADSKEECLVMRGTLMKKTGTAESSVEVRVSPLRDEEGKHLGCVFALHDVSDLLRLARRMIYQATHDALTGLINRREFEACLAQAMSSARLTGRHHAMFYIDLDQFKVVNDTCGHSAGDDLLRQLAAQLHTAIGEKNTLARLGGDEFGVLLEDCSQSDAIKIAKELTAIVRNFRYAWEDRVFEVGVSIGLVPITPECGGVGDVLRAADSACYMAKDAGRNRIHVFQANDVELTRRHGEMQWVSKITSAVESNRFMLYRQAIVPLHYLGGVSRHYELLIRLRGGNNDVISPGQFIPAAERYNLMPAIDKWVVEEAFSFLSRFYQNKHPQEIANDSWSVNLSGATLGDEQFLDYIKAQLIEHKIPPSLICFEITETAAVASLSKAISFIRELKNMGCRFALDDFGSGLSSFSYLKNLPVDYLKIDGYFVRDLITDAMSREIVKSIDQIGRTLGLRTIAEFVETPAIFESLKQMGVDYAQGYGIETPQPLSALLS